MLSFIQLKLTQLLDDKENLEFSWVIQFNLVLNKNFNSLSIA